MDGTPFEVGVEEVAARADLEVHRITGRGLEGLHVQRIGTPFTPAGMNQMHRRL